MNTQNYRPYHFPGLPIEIVIDKKVKHFIREVKNFIT